jgi:hypothetical protein
MKMWNGCTWLNGRFLRTHYYDVFQRKWNVLAMWAITISSRIPFRKVTSVNINLRLLSTDLYIFLQIFLKD